MRKPYCNLYRVYSSNTITTYAPNTKRTQASKIHVLGRNDLNGYI